jgi:TM2 domain-containing membrane protein YozV
MSEPLPPEHQFPVAPQPAAFPAGAVTPAYDGAVTQSTFMAQSAYDDAKKSVGIGYLLWFFFGVFGAHRFYLRQTGTAVAMLILSLTVVGLVVTVVWELVDAFLIPGMTTRVNGGIKREVFGRHGIAA